MSMQTDGRSAAAADRQAVTLHHPLSMQLRPDPDLQVLEQASREDLDILYNYLVFDKDENERLTTELPYQGRVKAHHPNHEEYWDLIGAELQLYGGNTFANLARGQGVMYREILCDVCKRVKANFNSDAPIEMIEQALLFKVLTDAIEKMSPEELRELANLFGLNVRNLTPQAVLSAVQAGIGMGGFAVYKLSVVVANAIARFILGRGLTFGANAALTKALSVIAGPIGWAVTGLWTVIDIAGPAYRVTVPSCVQIAYIRARALSQDAA